MIIKIWKVLNKMISVYLPSIESKPNINKKYNNKNTIKLYVRNIKLNKKQNKLNSNHLRINPHKKIYNKVNIHKVYKKIIFYKLKNI